MIRAINLVAALGMMLIASSVIAAPLNKGNYSNFNYNQTQRSATITPNGNLSGAASSPLGSNGTQIGQSGWYTGNGAAWNAPSGTTMLEHNGNVFFAGTKYPFQAGYNIPKESIVSAAASLLGGTPGLLLGAGLIAYPYLKAWLEETPGIRINPSSGQPEHSPSAEYAGFEYSTDGQVWFPDPMSAAQHWAAKQSGDQFWSYTVTSIIGSNGSFQYIYSVQSKTTPNAPPREYTSGINSKQSDKTYEDWLPASMNDIAPYLARARNPHPNVTKEIIEAGGQVDLPQPNITGPTQVVQQPVVKKTESTTNVNGQPTPTTTTTTTTTTNNYNITNNTINNTSNTTKTTTTVVNSNTGQVISEDTKTETEEPEDKEEPAPTDTPLGDIPELYKQKYPNGISGVFNTKIAELKATPLFNLPSLLMPALPNSGSCPSWQIDLQLAGWADMGTHTVQAPCMVWDFGKVIILISALLLARRLIFGG